MVAFPTLTASLEARIDDHLDRMRDSMNSAVAMHAPVDEKVSSADSAVPAIPAFSKGDRVVLVHLSREDLKPAVALARLALLKSDFRVIHGQNRAPPIGMGDPRPNIVHPHGDERPSCSQPGVPARTL